MLGTTIDDEAAADIIIHAGPTPLHLSYLKERHFDGHAVILRPRLPS